MLSKDWDFSVEDQEAEFRDDLRAASGVGRKKGKKKQVRTLIGEGNQAFVDCDIPEAIRVMQEVIRIEPRAAAAWSVLASCYHELHEDQKSLQLRIMAAHLQHDPDEWDTLAKESKALGFNQQALYCYRKLYSLDPANVDALWDRASLAKETGDLRTARNALVAILKRFPHDLTVLDELRPILIELSDLALCADLYQEAFTFYHAQDPAGGSGFGLMEVLVLADLHNTLGAHEHAVHAIRRGARWLQGRAAQRFWDVCEDDREFDIADAGVEREGEVQPGYYPLDVNARHRLAVARIKMGEIVEGKIHAAVVLSQEVLDYAALFSEIADAYYERDMYAEALPIYEILSEHVETSSLHILLQVASCHRMLGDSSEAARVYEHIIAGDPSNNEAKMKLAEVYEILNETRKALALVYEVIDSRKERRKAAGKDDAGPGEGPTTSLFEERAQTRASGKGSSKKDPHKLTKTQLRELEEQKEREVMRGYHRLDELWPRLREKGDPAHEDVLREWVLEAEKLVETFRETRDLFPTTRSNPFRGMFARQRRRAKETDEAEEERMASRLHLDIEHDSMARKRGDGKPEKSAVNFRGVSLDNWLNVFLQYTFILAESGQFEVADDILRHILTSNAYQTDVLQDTIRIGIITCAIASRRYSVVVEQCRKILIKHQFNNEPLRILLASLASGLRQTDAFIASTLQKHLLRETKLIDMAVKDKDQLKWNGPNKRYVLATGGPGKADDDDDGDAEDDDESKSAVPEEQDRPKMHDTPTKNNPIIVALYGQICAAAKSYQSAIFYLLHGYDYCREDPVICLSLAATSIGRAMQRQADNRHHLVAQAMAFLSQYRVLRRASAPDKLDEIEFNFGRAFHQLGLYSHAARHYERVLELVENRQADGDGVAREAAYNLSFIYVTTGATPLAQGLYRRWLSI
ncbi:hypothetical protein PLICRDRAFT_118961 [Plicaturopsis crispa FD-325 SS-3]|uniref:TPR-like protein n=1 Tax=Plicaturopsis crispa FD-325 SS-3 TaxID=944288 RepID=A0A0C9T3D0_PLICR|nr:hypothetical protein PLICRDRAFT_118961 [Plicaturopsis crispa FD-325 SS-3]